MQYELSKVMQIHGEPQQHCCGLDQNSITDSSRTL